MVPLCKHHCSLLESLLFFIIIWTTTIDHLNNSICHAVPLSSHQTIERILSKISKWQNDYYRYYQNQQFRNRVRNPHNDENDTNVVNNEKDDEFFDLPFVLVTFAQTLDGMIAIQNDSSSLSSSSSNLAISSPDSFLLTHALRSIHSAILVGGRTLAIDNPRLTNRLYHNPNKKSSTIPQQQPQVVVLDTNLRHTLQLIHTNNKNKQTQTAKNIDDPIDEKDNLVNSSRIRACPILVCCSYEAAETYKEQIHRYNLEQRRMNDDGMIEDAICLEPCPLSSSSHDLDLKQMLHNLKANHNIQSIMVEGGSVILSNFLMMYPLLVHAILITVSPTFMGAKYGLAALSQASFSNNYNEQPLFQIPNPNYTPLGTDLIVSSCLFSTTK